MVYVILIVFGVCLGSFVNALVWRINAQSKRATATKKKPKTNKSAKSPELVPELSAAQLSIVRGRSVCSQCHHELAALDLIPVVSYVLLRGRCRYCNKSIQDTPFSELLLPVLIVASYIWWPSPLHTILSWSAFAMWVLALTVFLALAIYDLRWMLLPNRLVYPLTLIATVFAGIQLFSDGFTWHNLILAVIAAAVYFGSFFVLYQVSAGRWIGGGDVKIAAALGLFCLTPAKVVLAIFLASLLGTMVAVPLMALRRLKAHSHIPFGPFLLAGCYVAVIWGQPLLDWYSKNFLVIH